jgi:hypothetical protein
MDWRLFWVNLYFVLLFAKDRAAKVPPLPFRRLLRVIVTSVWMLLIYRIYGLNKAMDRLKSIRCKDPVRIKNPLSEFLYARRVMVWSQFVVSLLNAGKIDSFLRSLSLCASLKKLGIPAQMVLGEKNDDHVIENLHVWVELRHVPLNESWEVEWHFREIKRIPERFDVH